MARCVTLPLAIFAAACSSPAARPPPPSLPRHRAPVAVDGAAARQPSLCEAVARAGGRCSADGVPTFDGPRQPRVRLVPECEAAAQEGRECSTPGRMLLILDY
jgi:hypothetical protein